MGVRANEISDGAKIDKLEADLGRLRAQLELTVAALGLIQSQLNEVTTHTTTLTDIIAEHVRYADAERTRRLEQNENR